MRIRRNKPTPSASRRNGISLFEVVLSIAIFFMAMVGISQLISIGTSSSVDGQLRTEAAIHCESKMNEVVAGAVELSDVSDQPLVDGDPSWKWSLTVQTDQPSEGLVDLTVTVVHINNQDIQNASYTLRRFIRNPQIFIDAAEAADAKAAEAAEEAAGLESTTGN